MLTSKTQRVLGEITKVDHFTTPTGRIYTMLPTGDRKYRDYKVYASLSRKNLIRYGVIGKPITLTKMGMVYLAEKPYHE